MIYTVKKNFEHIARLFQPEAGGYPLPKDVEAIIRFFHDIMGSKAYGDINRALDDGSRNSFVSIDGTLGAAQLDSTAYEVPEGMVCFVPYVSAYHDDPAARSMEIGIVDTNTAYEVQIEASKVALNLGRWNAITARNVIQPPGSVLRVVSNTIAAGCKLYLRYWQMEYPIGHYVLPW